MNNAATVGFVKGLPFNYGIFTGFSSVMLLCTLFSSLLLTHIPQMQLPMKILGASYMVYLAVKTWLPAKKRAAAGKAGTYAAGALLQLINPKIYIYGINAIANFILPYHRAWPVLAGFAVLLAFIGCSGNICWALFGSAFSKLFSRHKLVVNIVMSALLLYCAAALFI
jgi:threonine/homoserine/homoserine lactone efflux protein